MSGASSPLSAPDKDTARLPAEQSSTSLLKHSGDKLSGGSLKYITGATSTVKLFQVSFFSLIHSNYIKKTQQLDAPTEGYRDNPRARTQNRLITRIFPLHFN